MLTLGDIKTEFLVRNQQSTMAAFYTDAILASWADQSNKTAGAYHKWPFTEGRVSTTYASLVTSEDGYLVGEYPEGWKSDSIRQMAIGGKILDKKNFFKFQRFVQDNPSDNAKIFSDYGRRYYVNPSIGLSGTITVWGQFTPATMDATDLTAPTVFTGEEEGNEAIVELMLSLARKREKKLSESLAHIKEAQRILDKLWENYKDELFGYQDTNGEGMFKRVDVLNGAMRDDLFKRDQWY